MVEHIRETRQPDAVSNSVPAFISSKKRPAVQSTQCRPDKHARKAARIQHGKWYINDGGDRPLVQDVDAAQEAVAHDEAAPELLAAVPPACTAAPSNAASVRSPALPGSTALSTAAAAAAAGSSLPTGPLTSITGRSGAEVRITPASCTDLPAGTTSSSTDLPADPAAQRRPVLTANDDTLFAARSRMDLADATAVVTIAVRSTCPDMHAGHLDPDTPLDIVGGAGEGGVSATAGSAVQDGSSTPDCTGRAPLQADDFRSPTGAPPRSVSAPPRCCAEVELAEGEERAAALSAMCAVIGGPGAVLGNSSRSADGASIVEVPSSPSPQVVANVAAAASMPLDLLTHVLPTVAVPPKDVYMDDGESGMRPVNLLRYIEMEVRAVQALPVSSSHDAGGTETSVRRLQTFEGPNPMQQELAADELTQQEAQDELQEQQQQHQQEQQLSAELAQAQTCVKGGARGDSAAGVGGGSGGGDAEGDDDEEDDTFDSLCFMRSLSTVVLPPRATLLPPQMHSCRRKTLVLDLDETLVHSTLEVSCAGASDFTFSVRFNCQEHMVYVRRRPHMLEFMQRVASLYEVVVFTASQRVYADQLLDLIDPQRSMIRHRMFRDSCVEVDGNYLKDLSVLGRDLRNTLIVDNSPQAFGFQIDNGVPIESWYDDAADQELLLLLPFLESLVDVDDVRPHIQQRYRLKERMLNCGL